MRLVISLLLLSLLSACIPGTIIRHVPRYKNNEPFHLKKSTEDIPNYPDASMAYVELDDMGDLWNDKEIKSAVDVITSANKIAEGKRTGAIVLTYVHGWAQNADPKITTKAGNLEMFKRLIGWMAQDESSDADSTGRVRRPIVGIFVSWRGTTGYWPFDYYNRNSAAGRVAGSTATEALLRITGAARGNAQARSIVIGHSMGGLIVEHSLIPAIDAYLLRLAKKPIKSQCDANSAREYIPADLIILINSASHAMEAQKFIGTLKRLRAEVNQPSRDCEFFSNNKPWPLPLLISLTSEGDWATRIVLNLAAYPMIQQKAFRDYPGMEYGQGETLSQRDLSLHTAGNFEPLASHWVRHMSLDPAEGPGYLEKVQKTSVKTSVQKCLDPDDWPKDSRNHRPEDQIPLDSFETLCFESKDTYGSDRFWILQKKHSLNSAQIDGRSQPTPYWIMHIPKSIVEEHSRIFTFSLIRFLRGLMRLTGASGIVPTQCDPPQPQGQCFDLNPNSIQLSARTPVACEPPPALHLAYEGLQSGCSSENLSACFSGEPFSFRLLRKDTMELYQAKDCESIQWDFADHTPLQFFNPVVHLFPADIEHALVEVKSPVVNRIITFPQISAINEIAPTISYRGARSNCSEQGAACWSGEPIRFTILGPNDVRVIWMIDGESKEGTSVEHRFTVAGTHKVHVSVSKDGKGGDANASIAVSPHCFAPSDEVAIQFNGAVSGCKPGGNKKCLFDEPITFSLANLPEGSEQSCLSVEWDYGDHTMGSGLATSHLYNSNSAAAVTVSAKVASTDTTISPTAPLGLICPPPKPVLLDYSGEISGCTRATVWSGTQLCRLGEAITFSLSQSSLAANCRRVQWSFSSSSEPQVNYSFQSPVPSVEVLVSSGGQEVSDIAPIRFDAVPNCPQLDQISISYVGDHGCTQYKKCALGENITFSAVPSEDARTGCPGVTFRWLFDDGTAQEGPTAAKSFQRSKPPHAVHLIAVRNGDVVMRTTTVNIPLLKCRALRCQKIR